MIDPTLACPTRILRKQADAFAASQQARAHMTQERDDLQTKCTEAFDDAVNREHELSGAEIGALTQQRRRPRVHGNGFIQLDLTPSKRLHVWGHPDIPRQAVPTPIHDHMFGFTSRVLLGRMANVRYEAVPDPDGPYQVHKAQVRDREDTVLRPIGQRVRLEQVGTDIYSAGESYSMRVGDLHESVVGEPTITIIEKTGTTLSQGGSSPRVFVLDGLVPDNEFNRYQLPEADLWRIIAEVLLTARLDRVGKPKPISPPFGGRSSSSAVIKLRARSDFPVVAGAKTTADCVIVDSRRCWPRLRRPRNDTRS